MGSVCGQRLGYECRGWERWMRKRESMGYKRCAEVSEPLRLAFHGQVRQFDRSSTALWKGNHDGMMNSWTHAFLAWDVFRGKCTRYEHDVTPRRVTFALHTLRADCCTAKSCACP